MPLFFSDCLLIGTKNWDFSQNIFGKQIPIAAIVSLIFLALLTALLWTTKARKYHVNVECVGSLWAYSIIRICMYQFNGVDNFLKLHLNLNSYHFIRYRLNHKCCLWVELPSKNPNPCRLCTALQNLVYFRVRNGCFAGNTHIPWKIWQKEKK